MTNFRRGSPLYVVVCSLLLAGVAVLSAWRVASGRQSNAMPSPGSIVTSRTYVSFDPVPRGTTFEAAAVLEIAKGFHMNSNKPSDDYLIPTTVTPNPPPGIRVVDVIYPPGQMKKFAFSPRKPLDVYSDSVALRLKMAVDEKAPLGPMSIPAMVRYQACNDSACLPPVKVPVIVRVEIAAAGASSHHQHPEIFPAAGTAPPARHP